MKINCDLGENFDGHTFEWEELMMPHLQMVNIACGGHSGSFELMQHTLKLAANHGVLVGAHPGYPDRENFGRKSLPLELSQIKETLLEQVSTLRTLAVKEGVDISYIKPHGALYHDMLKRGDILETIFDIFDELNLPQARLMFPMLPDIEEYRRSAERRGVEMVIEVFADRGYLASGHLVPRTDAGAVLEDVNDIINQVKGILDGRIQTVEKGMLPVKAHTLCFHGDNPTTLKVLPLINRIIDEA